MHTTMCAGNTEMLALPTSEACARTENHSRSLPGRVLDTRSRTINTSPYSEVFG